MNRLRALSITAALFAAHACLLPSCIQWHIGQNIREAAETRVGVYPMDVWYVGEGTTPLPKDLVGKPIPWQYADGLRKVAREARYEADTPLVSWDYLTSFTRLPAGATDITITPHYRQVCFRYHKFKGMEAEVGERVDTRGQKMQRADLGSMVGWHETLDARHMGCGEVERAWWYPLAWVAAAPFDYIVDPALTVASTPAALLAGGVACCYWYTRWSRPEGSDPPTTPATP